MTKISYSNARSVGAQSTSRFLFKQGSTDLISKLSLLKSPDGRWNPLWLLTLPGLILIGKILISMLAGKTRVIVELEPLPEGAKMLRFIKKTITLTAWLVLSLVLALLAAFGAIVILLIQLIAHGA